MDRTNCIYGVRDAMEREDYESAAGFVGTYLEIEEGQAPEAAPDGAQASEQAQVNNPALLGVAFGPYILPLKGEVVRHHAAFPITVQGYFTLKNSLLPTRVFI